MPPRQGPYEAGGSEGTGRVKEMEYALQPPR
jgi:hypothetical protein